MASWVKGDADKITSLLPSLINFFFFCYVGTSLLEIGTCIKALSFMGDCLRQFLPGTLRLKLRGTGVNSWSLQSPLPGLKFMCLLPITQMGRTPPRYLGILVLDPTALTQVLTMDGCQVFVDEVGDMNKVHPIQS